jgi:hypothetical protein
VVDKVALGRVFSEYFGFPCQSSFHQILHHHDHLGQATMGQSVATVLSGPSLTPSTTKQIKKKKELTFSNWDQTPHFVEFLLEAGSKVGLWVLVLQRNS